MTERDVDRLIKPCGCSYHGHRLAWPCPEHAVGGEPRVWGRGEHVVKPCGCSYHGHILSCPCPEHDPKNAGTQVGEVRRFTDLDGRLWEVHETRLGVAAGRVPQASPMFTFHDPFTGRRGWILSSRGLEETQVDELLELLSRADFGDERGDFTSST